MKFEIPGVTHFVIALGECVLNNGIHIVETAVLSSEGWDKGVFNFNKLGRDEIANEQR